MQDAGVHVMTACPGRMGTGLNKHAIAGDDSTIEVPGIASDVQPNDVAEAIFVAAHKNKNLVEFTGSAIRCVPFSLLSSNCGSILMLNSLN